MRLLFFGVCFCVPAAFPPHSRQTKDTTEHRGPQYLLDRFVDSVAEIPRLVRNGTEYSTADYVDATTEEVCSATTSPWWLVLS